VNFVEHGNPEAMRLAIADVLRGDHVTPTDLYPNVADLGSVEGFARRIQTELFDNPAITGGQVRKFRRDMFLHLSEQYEQHKDAIHRSDDAGLDIDPGSFAGILAKHFRALADELAEKSASGK
jgi:hypothetical protein